MTVRLRVILFGLLLFGGLSSMSRANDGSEVFTLNFPFGANEATPVWLGHPVTPATTFATLNLPIVPPEGASLLVTVFFHETNGGFLRISWQAGTASADNTNALPGPGEAAQSAVLCDNFYEGIGMTNQRSLLVPADRMKQPGQLVFQSGDSALGISRIKFEWLQSSTGLSSPAITDTLVTAANGKSEFATELAGQPPTAQDPAWHDRIVDVPVTELPLRIEQGVDFTLQMDGPPALARVSLKESGLPWGQHLIVWLNNQRAGVILPAVPELGDAGYPDDKGTTYVGWRAGTFYVPSGMLVPGSNTLQFSAEPDLPSAVPDPNAPPAPLAVKNVDLQLDYPATSAPAANVGSGTPAPPVPPAPATPLPVSDAAPSGTVVTPSNPDAITAPVQPVGPPEPAPDPSTTPAPNAQNPALLSLPFNSSTDPSNTHTP